MRPEPRLFALLCFGVVVRAVNFPWESVQLTVSEASKFDSVAFGNSETERAGSRRAKNTTECRAFPGGADWPAETDWRQLNKTMDGALLRPQPVAEVCYAGPKYNADRCKYLVRAAGASRLYIDDPLTSLTSWTQGNTCLASTTAQGNCTHGAFPLYVVNATNVKQIQAAVNFARNRNVRLVIKNTGHDFGGRSSGAGSLSVWVHHLKSFEYLAEYALGQYKGMAVRVGAGVEAWEMFNQMGALNITVAAPCCTVGMAGGWIGSGGHSTVVSTLGLGADQVLSAQVVTADGKLVTADPNTNKDLFWAIRGGGAGTYGIVTSLVLKAFPPINITSSSVNFIVGAGDLANVSGVPFGNFNGTNMTRGRSAPNQVADKETFWTAVGLYYRFGQKIVDAGGYVFGYIYPRGNGTFTFSSSHDMVGMTPQEAHAFMQPLYNAFQDLGVNITNPLPRGATRYGRGGRTGGGDQPNQTRYRSRLIPRRNWLDDGLWNQTVQAIRTSVEEAGPAYNFHGIMTAATTKVAGWPGVDSAVNPAWRNGLLHAMLMEKQALNLTAEQAKQKDQQAKRLTDYWRVVSPASGAYMNEGDPAEPNWQQSFYGGLYPRLLEIKRLWDPWGLFWAPTTVGSEVWEVAVADGYPHSQNGRLCRVPGLPVEDEDNDEPPVGDSGSSSPGSGDGDDGEYEQGEDGEWEGEDDDEAGYGWEEVEAEVGEDEYGDPWEERGGWGIRGNRA